MEKAPPTGCQSRRPGRHANGISAVSGSPEVTELQVVLLVIMSSVPSSSVTVTAVLSSSWAALMLGMRTHQQPPRGRR